MLEEFHVGQGVVGDGFDFTVASVEREQLVLMRERGEGEDFDFTRVAPQGVGAVSKVWKFVRDSGANQGSMLVIEIATFSH